MDTMFFRPKSEEEALFLLSTYKEKSLIVNGGTDAVLFLKEGKVKAEVIIHVSSIPGFDEINVKDGNLEIGAGVTFASLMANEEAMKFSGLSEAIGHLASPPIRRIATLAGNICTAAPAADGAAISYALGASLRVKSMEGERIIPLSQFYNTATSYSTKLRKDELVTAILIPTLEKGEGSAYTRLSRRKAQDIAKIMVGARIRLENGRIAKASISLGAVNAQLVHAETAEKALVGMNREEAITYALSTFPPEAKLHASYYTEYKKEVLPGAMAETIRKAFDSAQEERP